MTRGNYMKANFCINEVVVEPAVGPGFAYGPGLLVRHSRVRRSGKRDCMSHKA